MSGGNQQTSQSSNMPYAGLQPYLDRLLSDAGGLYSRGMLAQPNTMNMVVPFSQQTQGAMDWMQNNASNMMQQNPFGNMFNQFGQTYGRDGMNDQMRQASSMFSWLGGMGGGGGGGGQTGQLPPELSRPMGGPSGSGMFGPANPNPTPAGNTIPMQRGGGMPPPNGGQLPPGLSGSPGFVDNGVTRPPPEPMPGGNQLSGLPYMGGAKPGGGPTSGGTPAAPRPPGAVPQVPGQQTGALANPALQGFQSLAQGQGPSVSEQNLMNIAQGGMLNRVDPNFEAVLGRATDSAAQQVNQSAGLSGRYGSGTHQNVLGDTVGQLQSQARLGQYNTERQNQVNAAGLIDSQRNNAFGNQLGALSGLGNTYATGIGQAMQAAGQQAGLGQNAMNNLGNAGNVFQSMWGAQNAPAQQMMGVGSMYEDLFRRQLDDRSRIAQQTAGAPFQNLQALSSLLGIAQPYGQQYTQSQGPSNMFSNMFGGGLGLASLLFGGQ